MVINSNDDNTRPLLGIYTPDLSGFYFGELVGQLLTLCRLKNYRVTVIKTGGLGKFKSRIHTESMDMVIILRNALHIELAEYLAKKGKSVISISYDYFPLKIPLVSSDNGAGVELAVSYLKEKGHQNFLFVGDLTNFDIRKRYEAFSELVAIHNLQIGEDEVFQVGDALISGGYEAADLYIRKDCKATAVICGSAMNGIGFTKRLENHDSNLKGVISVVAFDAISLIPVINPAITTIDQNLNLIAYKALSVVDGTAKVEKSVNHHTVKPKIITRDSDFMKSEDAYLATSFELAELYNANYMKSILCNITEWSQSIADSKLDNIMVLRALFKNFLSGASMSRAMAGKNGALYLVYTKLVGLNEIKNVDLKDAASVCKEQNFPSSYHDLNPEKYDICIHVPRYIDGSLWGFISTYGIAENNELPCSYTGFSVFLDHIVEWMSSDTKIAQGGIALSEEPAETKIVEGEIIWNRDSNEVEWENSALEILGFTSELEQKIYKNMELYDRLEEKYVGLLREYLLGGKKNNFPLEVKYKNKSRELVLCELRYEGEDDDKKAIIKISQSSSAI